MTNLKHSIDLFDANVCTDASPFSSYKNICILLSNECVFWSVSGATLNTRCLHLDAERQKARGLCARVKQGNTSLRLSRRVRKTLRKNSDFIPTGI